MGLIWADTLTWPPSGNVMSRTGKGRHYPNPVYAQWLWANMPRVSAVPLDHVIDYPIRLEGLFRSPTRRVYDLDNRCKPVQDLLQKAGVFVNDHLIHRLELEKAPIVKGAGGWVRVELHTL